MRTFKVRSIGNMKISIIWIVCTSSVMVKAGLSDLGIRRKVERIKKL